jgi:beta-galactosidase
MADVAYGAFGTLYFEWRPPVSGSERGYVSVLEKDGSFGASVDEIRKVRSEIDSLWPRLKDAKTSATVAMIFSFDNQWDRGFGETSAEARALSYTGNFARFYGGLKALRNNIDIVAPVAPLDGYELVVAPGLQMVSDELATRLRAFVEQGGCLVLDQGAGTRDAIGHDRQMRGPGVFAETAGVSVVATSRVDGEIPGYKLTIADGPRSYSALCDIEQVELKGAREIARLTRPQETALPAVTVHGFGKGRVVYFAAGSEEAAFYEDGLMRMGQMIGLKPLLDVPAGVDVVSRSTGVAEYLFLMNMTPETQRVTLTGSCRDAIKNEPVTNALLIEAFDARVLVREL